MAVTLATVPAYAVPGQRVRITATLTGGGNFFRLWLTNAPDGSGARAQIEAMPVGTARLELASGYADTSVYIDLDVGGVYLLTAQEYVKGASTYGGGYESDPSSYETEAQVGAESTLQIVTGQRLEQRVGAPAYGYATLRLWVWDSTVRATTAALHGEATPALLSPTTQRMATAMQATAVRAAVAALVNKTTATLMGTIATLVADMRIKLPAHFHNVGGAYHATADTNNDTEIEGLQSGPLSPEGYARAAQVLRSRLWQHMTNAEDYRYHINGIGSVEPDYDNALVAALPGSANDMGAVIMAIADVARAYEQHRVDTNHHGLADAANALVVVPGTLLLLHQAVLDALRQAVPTVPTINTAALQLLHSAGFRDSTSER